MANIGGIYNDNLSLLLIGIPGDVRITGYRALHTNLRNNSGIEIGTVAHPLVTSAGGSVPNTNGSVDNQTVTTTPVTFIVPANSVGFILESESPNTDNIRWAIGATASSTVGTLSEPGRDTGFIPCAANISVVALSGSQKVSVQWVLTS